MIETSIQAGLQAREQLDRSFQSGDLLASEGCCHAIQNISVGGRAFDWARVETGPMRSFDFGNGEIERDRWKMHARHWPLAIDALEACADYFDGRIAADAFGQVAGHGDKSRIELDDDARIGIAVGKVSVDMHPVEEIANENWQEQNGEPDAGFEDKKRAADHRQSPNQGPFGVVPGISEVADARSRWIGGQTSSQFDGSAIAHVEVLISAQ